MKVHKIRNVPKETCVAEQKIAYNLTFAHYDLFRKRFLALPTESAKSEAIAEMRDTWLRWYRQGYDYKEGRFNEDAIFVALNNGIRQYIEKPFIATDYEAIGKCFAIPYEMEVR